MGGVKVVHCLFTHRKQPPFTGFTGGVEVSTGKKWGREGGFLCRVRGTGSPCRSGFKISVGEG